MVRVILIIMMGINFKEQQETRQTEKKKKKKIVKQIL
jgi:hypothetical protein